MMRKLCFSLIAAAIFGLAGCESMFEANPQKMADLLYKGSCGVNDHGMHYNGKVVPPSKLMTEQEKAACEQRGGQLTKTTINAS